ncbi:MAG: ComEC/Rec2 family competence protein, partial [Stellaceae bacterium]
MAAHSGSFAAADLPSDPPRLAARLKENFLAERERWPLWLPVFLGAGIGCYFWLPREPAPALGPTLLVLAVGVLVVACRSGRGVAAAAAVAALALGFAAAQVQTRLVAAPV